jgi:hypothetical protein
MPLDERSAGFANISMNRTDSIGSACPSADELARFASGDLAVSHEALIQRHLAKCDACRSEIDETARALHTYRAHMREITAAEGPRWESFRAALAAQDEVLHRRPGRPLIRRWSWAAAAAMLAITAVFWYRYTEVPLSAETVLTRAMTHDEQYQPRDIATVAFRRTSDLVSASDQAAVKRVLTHRLASYGFDAGSPLSAAHFQRWRRQIRQRDDRVLQLSNDLIKVSTVSADADAAIREGEIVVRLESYEPIAQTWRFADGLEVEVSRVPDATPVPRESVVPEHVGAAALPPAAQPDLDLIEVETRAALHRLGVSVSGAVAFRQTGDRVVITGALPTSELVAAVTSYAGNHLHVEPRVHVATPSASTASVHIAHAPAFQTWLEEAFGDDAQQRARFVPRAADLTDQLLEKIQQLSALGQRYSPHRVSRLSREARANLRSLAAAQYRDVTTAHEALERHFSSLVASPAVAVSGELPKDWQARAAVLPSSIERLRGGLTRLLGRTDLHTTDELRAAAEEALRPGLGELAGALSSGSIRD